MRVFGVEQGCVYFIDEIIPQCKHRTVRYLLKCCLANARYRKLKDFWCLAHVHLRIEKEHGNFQGQYAQESCWVLKMASIAHGTSLILIRLGRSIWHLIYRSFQLVKMIREAFMTGICWACLSLKTFQVVLPLMSIWRSFLQDEGLEGCLKLVPDFCLAPASGPSWKNSEKRVDRYWTSLQLRASSEIFAEGKS